MGRKDPAFWQPVTGVSADCRGAVAVYRFDGVDSARAAVAVLAAHVGMAADAMAFAVGPYGKPYLADSDWCFNLSHSRGIRLLAIARGRDVGVDVEKLRPLRRREAWLARCFTASERARLAAAPDRECLRYWAAKEALVKAIGRGLAYGLTRIEIAHASDGTLSIARCDGPGGPASRWQLCELPPIEDSVAMLVQPAPALPIACFAAGRSTSTG